jgi:hypothetical protein
MKYSKHLDNYIKANRIPIPMKGKLRHLQDERNVYSSFIYTDLLINISEHPGNETIYLN